MHGSIPANWWQQFSEALPNVTFQDVSEEFSHLMLVKSEEELAQMRYAAAAAEAACAAMGEATRVGVGEEVPYAEAVRVMFGYGIGIRYPNIVMNSGPHTLSWGPPRWTTRGEPPRILQRGDLLQAELMPMCGNQEVQVQMTVSLDPIDETSQRCEKIARESYEVGLKALRPGITFTELTEQMAEPLREYGAWAYTPLVHSLGPHFLLGRPTVNTEGLDLGVRFVGVGGDIRGTREAVIQAGMVFAFEPNACLGDHRVNIGGTVILTEDGPEELNTIPTRLNHK
jgi:Xaa-Pro aminopeptidase